MADENSKIRLVLHSGRQGNARHNDRSFLDGKTAEWKAEHAGHIRDGENLVKIETWNGVIDIEASEKEFYRLAFSDSLEAKNERYIAQRHPERCKTLDDLYTGKQTRPEEVILQIGGKDSGITPEIFIKCLDAYIDRLNAWNEEHGFCMGIMSCAVHLDEATPHAHLRRIWAYTDRDGNTQIGQNKALEQAGIGLPDPTKPVGRYNNRKMEFDRIAREMWMESCIEHGLEINFEPRVGARHLESGEYKAAAIQAEIDKKRQESQELTAKIDTLRQESTGLTAKIDTQKKEATRAAQEAENAQETARAARTALEEIEARTRALTKREVEETAARGKKGVLGRVVLSQADYDSLVRTARTAEEAVHRADTVEAERAHIIDQAQKQATNIVYQATQETEKARKNRDAMLKERDAIAREAENLRSIAQFSKENLSDYEDVRGGIVAAKLIGLLDYRPKRFKDDPTLERLVMEADSALDKVIKQIPRDLMPEILQDLERASKTLERHTVKDLDELEL